MDFRLSNEQQQFSDSLRRWVASHYSFEARLKIIHTPQGCSASAYADLVELGCLSLAIPESAGGLDGDAIDLMVVMTELGRGLVVEPYLATVLGAQFLKHGNHGEAMAKVAEGHLKLACALHEKGAGYELSNISTRAQRDGDRYILQGEKCSVVHGAQADAFIVSVRTSGSQRDPAGISLMYVPRDAPGITVVDYRTFDGQRGADIQFTDVQLPANALISQADQGWNTLEAVTDFGVALLCAEAVGAMEVANALTLDYLKTRKQFDVAIGSFQALQHRMADMYIHLEQARSLTILAVFNALNDDAGKRSKLVSAAKVRVGKAMRVIGQESIQMHGGMGMADESAISHYFKRLTAIEMTLGNSDFHRHRFMSNTAFVGD
jgi:alkylation response protein AidB-like acyl-CoA dehydrogenase